MQDTRPYLIERGCLQCQIAEIRARAALWG